MVGRSWCRRFKVWKKQFWSVHFRYPHAELQDISKGALQSTLEPGHETWGYVHPDTKRAYLSEKLWALPKEDRTYVTVHEAVHMAAPDLRHDVVVEIAHVASKMLKEVLK